MKRFSIMVRQYGADKETELCQCDTGPEAIVQAAQAKTIKIDRGDRKVTIAKYEQVYFVDHQTAR